MSYIESPPGLSGRAGFVDFLERCLSCITWARRADMSHILKHGFWASAHPFFHNYFQALGFSIILIISSVKMCGVLVDSGSSFRLFLVSLL